MYSGNWLHEAGRWEIAGRNVSEGIEPRNYHHRERSTVFICWKTECC